MLITYLKDPSPKRTFLAGQETWHAYIQGKKSRAVELLLRETTF
jgi:hypothetical protein